MKAAVFKIVQITGIVVFLAVVLFAILFAEGYQYDPAARDIVKKGVVYFENLPGDVSVFTDGQRAPQSVSGELRLRPGWHDIELRRPGFLPWKKRVDVSGDFVARFPKLLFLPVSGRAVHAFPLEEAGGGFSLQSFSEKGVFFVNQELHFGKYYFLAAPRRDFRTIELPLKFLFAKLVPIDSDSVLGLTKEGRAFVYDGARQKLNSLAGEFVFTDIKEADGNLFALDAAGKIWKLSKELSEPELFAGLALPAEKFLRVQSGGGYVSFLMGAKAGNVFAMAKSDGSIVFQEGGVESAFMEEPRVFYTKGGELIAYDAEEKKIISKRKTPAPIKWLSRIGETYQFVFLTGDSNLLLCDEDIENCRGSDVLGPAGNSSFFIESSKDRFVFMSVLDGRFTLFDFGQELPLPTFLQNLVSAVFAERS